MILVTIVLVIGIREERRTNATLVLIKVSVVLFVIAVGIGYVETSNWTQIPVEQRVLPGEGEAIALVKKELAAAADPRGADAKTAPRTMKSGPSGAALPKP